MNSVCSLPFWSTDLKGHQDFRAILNLCLEGPCMAPFQTCPFSLGEVSLKKYWPPFTPLQLLTLGWCLRPGIPSPVVLSPLTRLLVFCLGLPFGEWPTHWPQKGDWDLSSFRSKGVDLELGFVWAGGSTYPWTTVRSERNFKLELGLPGHLKVYLTTW